MGPTVGSEVGEKENQHGSDSKRYWSASVQRRRAPIPHAPLPPYV